MTHDQVRSTDDHNLQLCQLQRLFDVTRAERLLVDVLMNLLVRSMRWVYQGIDVDDWIIQQVPESSDPQPQADKIPEAAKYVPLGLGEARSTPHLMSTLKKENLALHTAIQECDLMKAPVSGYLKAGETFKSGGNYRHFCKLLRFVFAYAVILHQTRQTQQPPPDCMKLRMHQANDAQVQVPWRWDLILRNAPVQRVIFCSNMCVSGMDRNW